MFGNDYSSSESSSSEMQWKKVDYKGPVISEEYDDSNNSNQSSKQKPQQKNSLNTKTHQIKEVKSKTIKKNCISAKMSRQRKKLYIELLQQKAQEYKNEIKRIKNKVQKQHQNIMNIVDNSNPQKHVYLKQKLSQSKAIAERIISPNAQSKKSPLSLHIDSFLYKFGSNGVLRKDVVQLQKQRWYQLAIDQKVLNSKKEETVECIQQFNKCLGDLDDKSKRMEYLIRSLQPNIKEEYIGRFLINKIFLSQNQASNQ